METTEEIKNEILVAEAAAEEKLKFTVETEGLTVTFFGREAITDINMKIRAILLQLLLVHRVAASQLS
jgi:hypothetical protein